MKCTWSIVLFACAIGLMLVVLPETGRSTAGGKNRSAADDERCAAELVDTLMKPPPAERPGEKQDGPQATQQTPADSLPRHQAGGQAGSTGHQIAKADVCRDSRQSAGAEPREAAWRSPSSVPGSRGNQERRIQEAGHKLRRTADHRRAHDGHRWRQRGLRRLVRRTGAFPADM